MPLSELSKWYALNIPGSDGVLMIRLPKPVASMFSSVVFAAGTWSTLIFLNPNLGWRGGRGGG